MESFEARCRFDVEVAISLDGPYGKLVDTRHVGPLKVIKDSCPSENINISIDQWKTWEEAKILTRLTRKKILQF